MRQVGHLPRIITTCTVKKYKTYKKKGAVNQSECLQRGMKINQTLVKQTRNFTWWACYNKHTKQIAWLPLEFFVVTELIPVCGNKTSNTHYENKAIRITQAHKCYTGWRTKCHTNDCARNTFLLLQKHLISGTELILTGWKIVPN